MQEISRCEAAKIRFKTLTPFVGLILLGVALGSLTYILSSDSLSGSLGALNTDYLSLRLGETYMEVFLSSLFNSTVMLLTLFFAGLCAAAFPFVLIAPVYKGLGIGASVSELYFSTGKEGIAYTLLLIVPSAVISCYAVMIGTREAYRMSSECFGAVFKNKIYTVRENARLYVVKFLVLEAILSVSATIDSVCSLIYNNIVA